MMEEFEEFAGDLQKELGGIRKEIKERKNKLVKDVEEFEKRLTKEEAARLKNSRGILGSLGGVGRMGFLSLRIGNEDRCGVMGGIWILE